MKEKKEELKCGSFPTADIVGAVGKIELLIAIIMDKCHQDTGNF